MRYSLGFKNPERGIIQVKATFKADNAGPVTLHFSRWRPGRYEFANYPANVVEENASDGAGNPLSFIKTDVNSWQIDVESPGEVSFEYGYFANEQNAGSSYFDEEKVYINGVNLFVYQADKLDEACIVDLDIPDDYKIACGLDHENNQLKAVDYHQLVDAPFFASAHLQHELYKVEDYQFHLWFEGKCKPDWDKLKTDFIKFTKTQLEIFGELPVREYHFLFYILNSTFYHGVEHYNSTVITLGPGHKLMKERYVDLLGVSCHELFHTWNVKAMRPADMVPYQYDRENFCRLHYITEGVTTYYGDLLLWKSGVWNLEEFLNVFNKSTMLRHFNSEGWKNITLEEASFNSWVNGYSEGVPNHKISYYSQGCLVAMLLDYRILKASGNKHSLDLVMRDLYKEFGNGEKGFTKADYKRIAEKYFGGSLDDFFADYIEGKKDLRPELIEAGNFWGMNAREAALPQKSAYFWGFHSKPEGGKATVYQVFNDSPASKAGLRKGDRINSINGHLIADSTDHAINFLGASDSIEVHYFRNEMLRSATLSNPNKWRGTWLAFTPNESQSETQIANQKAWRTVVKSEMISNPTS